MPDQPVRLVLASQSPTRAGLLKAAGVAAEAVAPVVDEDELKASLKAASVAPEDAAVALAELKAGRVAGGLAGETLVIGADQLLVLGEHWLDKPADLEAARRQLWQLRGREHRFFTAAVVLRNGSRVWHHIGRARVWFRPFTEAFLDRYLEEAGEAVLGSVGAYQLEGRGAQLLGRIEGDHFSVLGLPLLPLLQCLRDQGVLER